MSDALFNSLTKEVFTEAKVVTYTWKILESKSFQEEHPRVYLSSQIRCFLNAVEFSRGKDMKMHAAVCLFDFVRNNFDQIKKEMPTILPILEKKAEEMKQEADADDSCVGCELYDMAEDILLLCAPPATPCKCSCSTSAPAPQKQEAPGAPRKIPHPPSMTEEEKPEVAKELFPVPSSSSNAAPCSVVEPKQTKKGEVYRGVSAMGKQSTVVCLDDNGAVLEIRYGEKTGKDLIKFGRKIFESYDAWLDELNWM